MYARTVRKLILLVAAVVALLGLLAGWRFTMALARPDNFEAPSNEPILPDDDAGSTNTVDRAWFASIGGLGGAITAPVAAVNLPPIKFMGCAIHADPARTTAWLKVGGKTESVKRGQQVAGGTVKDINEERILFEHGGRIHEIALEKRDYSRSTVVPAPAVNPGAPGSAKPIRRLPPRRQP